MKNLKSSNERQSATTPVKVLPMKSRRKALGGVGSPRLVRCSSFFMDEDERRAELAALNADTLRLCEKADRISRASVILSSAAILLSLSLPLWLPPKKSNLGSSGIMPSVRFGSQPLLPSSPHRDEESQTLPLTLLRDEPSPPELSSSYRAAPVSHRLEGLHQPVRR